MPEEGRRHDTVNYTIDGISFTLKKQYDIGFLSRHGRMFCVFDQNDSGNISFGFDDGKERHFVKVAGLETTEFKGSPQDAVRSLERAILLYTELRHPNLIELTDHCRVDDVYVAVFRWSEGDCLFDHWNSEKYSRNPAITPPYEKFKQLPFEKAVASVRGDSLVLRDGSPEEVCGDRLLRREYHVRL